MARQAAEGAARSGAFLLGAGNLALQFVEDGTCQVFGDDFEREVRHGRSSSLRAGIRPCPRAISALSARRPRPVAVPRQACNASAARAVPSGTLPASAPSPL